MFAICTHIAKIMQCINGISSLQESMRESKDFIKNELSKEEDPEALNLVEYLDDVQNIQKIFPLLTELRKKRQSVANQ